MQQYKVYNMYLGTFAMFENRVRAINSYHTTSMAAAFRKKPYKQFPFFGNTLPYVV